jgi:hypothetical protein
MSAAPTTPARLAAPARTRRQRWLIGAAFAATGLAGFWLGARSSSDANEPFVVEGEVISADERGVCVEGAGCFELRLFDDGFEPQVPEVGDEIGLYVVTAPMAAPRAGDPDEERSGLERFAAAWWPRDGKPADLDKLPTGDPPDASPRPRPGATTEGVPEGTTLDTSG